MWVCRASQNDLSEYLEFHMEEPSLQESLGCWRGRCEVHVEAWCVDGCIEPGTKAEVVSFSLQENCRFQLIVKREPTLAEVVESYLKRSFPGLYIEPMPKGRLSDYFCEGSGSRCLYEALEREKAKEAK